MPTWSNPMRVSSFNCGSAGYGRLIFVDITAVSRDDVITQIVVNNSCNQPAVYKVKINSLGFERTFNIPAGVTLTISRATLQAQFGRDITFREVELDGPTVG